MRIAVVILCIGLVGCASDKAYYEAIKAKATADMALATARAESDMARYSAIAMLGKSGGDTAKVAAVMSLMQQPAVTATPTQSVNIPAPSDRFLQTLQAANSLITPWIAPAFGYKQAQVNAGVAINQAQVNKDIFVGSYNALAQVAAQIPQPSTVNTNTQNTTTNNTTTSSQSTTNSLGRDGVIGSGAFTRSCVAGSGGLGAADVGLSGGNGGAMSC